MSEHQGDQGRSETTPFGDGGATKDAYGQESSAQGSYGESTYGQGGGYGQSSYGQSSGSGQSSYDQGGYAQGAYGQGSYGQGSYGQGSYGQGSYGQGSYGQGSYGQGSYGQGSYSQPQTYGGYDQAAAYPQQGQQPAGYGQSYGYGPAAPSKPGSVITAAVFGFIFGAFGVLASLAMLVFVAVAVGAGAGAISDLDDIAPGLGSVVGAAVGIGVVVALLVVAWTVVTIWGSVWALTGRSRVMLIVAGSISIATTGFGLVANLANAGDQFGGSSAGDVVLSLVFFGVAVAIVVLLCLAPSTQFFAAHRARRGRQ